MIQDEQLDPQFDLKAVFGKAQACHLAGFFDRALDMYHSLLRLRPDFFEAHLNIAKAYQSQANFAKAIHHSQKATQLRPDHPDAHNNLGCIFNQLKQFEAATSCFQRAVALDPEFAEAHYNLGVALRNRARISEAIACFQAALHFEPNLAMAHHALGSLLQQQGQMAEAAACYQKTLRLDRNLPEAHYNLGNVLKAFGRLDEAIECYKKAIALRSNFAQAYNNLGLALMDQHNLEAALVNFRQAYQLDPGFAAAYYNTGIRWQLGARYEEGLRWFHKAMEVDPNYAPARWSFRLSLPVLYDTEKDILKYRQRFSRNLDRLTDEIRLDTAEQRTLAMQGVGSQTNFYLPYQGRNDVALQKTYGEFAVRVMQANYPQWSHRRPMPSIKKGERIRVGYLSPFMRNHVLGEYLIGWLENHDRTLLEVINYHIGNQTDGMTPRFQQNCDRFYQISDSLSRAAEQITHDNLHVLVFSDIFMNNMAMQLASLRLAPVQCLCWGHPVTSGLPTMDYYLSSDLMEPDDAQAHYTEKLVRLPNISLAYRKPELPNQPRSRMNFGFQETDRVYLISQSLYKCLPQHDEIYARIAGSVPHAKFCFIAHKSKDLTQQFERRLAKAFGRYQLNYEHYCRFLPRMNMDDFLSLNMAADVLLDTFCWSGGKTSLEGISCGLPVVTCPGEFMRGRHTYGILSMMNFSETIARSEEDYIRIAVKLGNDRNYYQAIKQKIIETRYRIYDDQQALSALEAFYLNVVNATPAPEHFKDRPAGELDGSPNLAV